MTDEKKQLGIVRFFSGYLHYFGKLFLTNLLFAVPLIAFSVGFYYLNVLTGLNSWAIMFLAVIFVYPFYSGVTLITRNIVKEEDNIPVFKLFIKGFKDNFLPFLLHGVVFYLVIFLCYSALVTYWQMAQSNSVFYVTFVITVIISILLLFTFYNLPVMTVTFDLSIKNLYKNSFLMSFGELKNNFFATLGLFLMFILCATIFFAATSVVALVISTLVVAVLIVPSTTSYIINFYVYEGMETLMFNKAEKEEQIKMQLEEKKTGKKPVIQKPEEIFDFSDLDLDENKDGDEYLFFNGKMIKRRVLIEMKNKQESRDE